MMKLLEISPVFLPSRLIAIQNSNKSSPWILYLRQLNFPANGDVTKKDEEEILVPPLNFVMIDNGILSNWISRMEVIDIGLCLVFGGKAIF
ncbi:hypothetical protein O6P43_026554 [Quillaja saponaria]|uniref:Uncharacterized protein n=1 Tax=Quillaja saponaria TaxID=32244 RepID=A0AAD7PCD6_QUISA|nr:hypothetical protein O6P43_026554 [Quillaja saponaria]